MWQPLLAIRGLPGLQIEIHAKRNEILDQSSLIMRYQAEIAALRQQLEEAAQGKGVVVKTGVDPLNPEVGRRRHFMQPIHECRVDVTFGTMR